MNILKTFASAENIAAADIRTIRKCFEYDGRGKRITLSADQLKTAAKTSIGIPSVAEEIAPVLAERKDNFVLMSMADQTPCTSD